MASTRRSRRASAVVVTGPAPVQKQKPRASSLSLEVLTLPLLPSRTLTTAEALSLRPPAGAGPWPAPHILRNRFLVRGFAIHAGPAEALADALLLRRVSNETGNVLTGLLLLVPAAYALFHAQSPLLVAEHAAALRVLAGVMLLNTACVVSYHSLLSVPRLYSLMSAVDLIGVASLQLAALAAAHNIAGVSLWAAASAQARKAARAALAAAAVAAGSLDGGAAALSTSFSWDGGSVLPGWPAPPPEPGIGLLFGLIPPLYAMPVHGAVIVASGLAVAATRLYIDRESPPALILINCLWYFVLLPDVVLARLPRGEALAMLVVLLAGGTLYLLKLPERALPGVFDLTLHSHFLWHLAYTTSFGVFCYDVVNVAFANSLEVRCIREGPGSPFCPGTL